MSIKKKILIIGLGKAGSAIAVELMSSGFIISGLVDSKINKLSKLRKVFPNSCFAESLNTGLIEISDIIIICVQDKNIKNVIDELKKYKKNVKNKIVFHLSGSTTEDIFINSGINRKYCGSFHPIQTFSEISLKNQKLLSGIYFGAEGGSDFLKTAKMISGKLKSKMVIIPKELKYLYHSICVFTSNFLVSYFSLIEKAVKKLKINSDEAFEIFKPLILNTFKNISEKGTVKSITGPVERNDRAVIQEQIKQIKKVFPELLDLYLILAKEAISLSEKKNSLKSEQAISLLKLINKR